MHASSPACEQIIVGARTIYGVYSNLSSIVKVDVGELRYGISCI